MLCLSLHALLNIPDCRTPGEELGLQPPQHSWLQAPGALVKAGGFARAPCTTQASSWHTLHLYPHKWRGTGGQAQMPGSQEDAADLSARQRN